MIPHKDLFLPDSLNFLGSRNYQIEICSKPLTFFNSGMYLLKTKNKMYIYITRQKSMQIERQQEVKGTDNKNLDEQGDFEHKTLNHNSLYYNFMERYFTNFENQYQSLHLHSNGICLIAVKPSTFISPPKEIKDFIQVSQVKGKKKKGGVKVRPQTVIARILCENGTQVKVLALIEGTILEKNETLAIQTIGKPQGFFVIILPNKKIYPEKFGMKKIPVDQDE